MFAPCLRAIEFAICCVVFILIWSGLAVACCRHYKHTDSSKQDFSSSFLFLFSNRFTVLINARARVAGSVPSFQLICVKRFVCDESLCLLFSRCVLALRMGDSMASRLHGERGETHKGPWGAKRLDCMSGKGWRGFERKIFERFCEEIALRTFRFKISKTKSVFSTKIFGETS